MRYRVVALARLMAGLIPVGCAKLSEGVAVAYAFPLNYEQFT
jgi:hypothetical protein